MIKFIFFIFVLSIAAPANAQNEVVEANIVTKEILEMTGAKVGEYIVAPGQTTQDNYSVFLMHPDKGLVQRVNLLRQSLKLQGVAGQEDKLTIFLSSYLYGGAERVEQITFSKSSGSFSATKEVKSIVHPVKLICGFTDGQDFCLITAQKKARTVTLERFSGGSVVSKKEFPVSDEQLFKALLKKDFLFIASGQETSFEQAKQLHKVYWRGDRLVFTSDDLNSTDDEPGVSLLTLHVGSGISAVHRVALEAEPKKRHNSFLYAYTLFVLGTNYQALQLAVFNVRDGRPLKQFSYQWGGIYLDQSHSAVRERGECGKGVENARRSPESVQSYLLGQTRHQRMGTRQHLPAAHRGVQPRPVRRRQHDDALRRRNLLHTGRYGINASDLQPYVLRGWQQRGDSYLFLRHFIQATVINRTGGSSQLQRI